MGSCQARLNVLFFMLFGLFALCQSFGVRTGTNQTAHFIVNASEDSGWQIPETLFGLFFEEINHAGAGGLWAELVSNRGFEAGGPNTPSNIDPWSVIGDESSLIVSTDRSSCFSRNKVALRMEVLCDIEGSKICPASGVGIYNPGYWGMNIEQGKTYKVAFYITSTDSVNISVSLASSDGSQILATANIIAAASDVSNWIEKEVLLEAKGTNPNSRLQLTTTKSGVTWFDQVSAMPVDTYMGHGFRKELVEMLASLKPRFVRFPGGCFVEGEWLRNAFRWKESIGPWEERPGHFGDVWMYWTDDGLGYFEFLQLTEDLGALPIWVFNNGISHNDQVNTPTVLPFVHDVLDSIEFARGDPGSKWGSVRAAMGHPEPFDLRYVAIGNEDCWKKNYKASYLNPTLQYQDARLGYDVEILDALRRVINRMEPDTIRAAAAVDEIKIFREGSQGFADRLAIHSRDKTKPGNYLKFYYAIKSAYPDIKIITNCDGSSRPVDHPADLYDFHVYTSANNMFSMAHQFDHTLRTGPKAFVSEYAVTGKDAGTGSLLAALAEAGFLIGLERNSDVIEMASYAPLLVNTNDRRWTPDAIVFNSWQQYGTPSYWMQQFFAESSGATVLDTTLQASSPDSLIASAITWKNMNDNNNYIRIKIVNFGGDTVNLKISVNGLDPNSIRLFGSTKSVLTSNNLMDENSFKEPKKVVPIQSAFQNTGESMDVVLAPQSFTSFDLLKKSNNLLITEIVSDAKSYI